MPEAGIFVEHSDYGGQPDSWSAAWTEARSRLLHVASPAGDDRWRQYWDMRSGSYAEQLSGDKPLREAVVDFMVREGLLVPGDSVLDVGCGPGPYSMLFARIAVQVAALDISPGMLDRLARSAASGGIGNIRTVCQDWKSYRDRKKHDLVFSSFCPGVDDPGMLLKMERHCRRSCCFVTGGSLGHPGYMYELWEALTGERLRLPAGHHFFAFNTLFEAGRMPSVRAFRYRSPRVPPEEEIVGNIVGYFDMLVGLDDRGREALGEMVSAYLSKMQEKEDADRSLYLVYWQPDRRSDGNCER